MQGLPSEIKDNIFLYVPIGDHISETTTREEIERLFLEKVKDYENHGLQPYTYIWTKLGDGRAIKDIVVRVTICCGEYIVGITLYDPKRPKIKEWNLSTRMDKRDVLLLPIQGSYRWYGRDYRIRYDNDKVTIDNAGFRYVNNRVVSTRSDVNPVILSKEEFRDFLDGDNSKLDIERVKFLDYNIIELLTDNRNDYYELLRVFRELYNEGYWTYGGFKNYIGTNERLSDEVRVVYDDIKSPQRIYFTLTRNGNVASDLVITPDVKNTLKMLGATIN